MTRVPALQLLVGLIVGLPSSAVHAETYIVASASNEGRADEPVLRFAERDASAFRDVFTQAAAQGQPPKGTLLLGRDAAQLEQTLAALKLTATDALYVYYSGHAGSDGLHIGTEVLGYTRLKELIDAVPGRVKLLVIDACESGQITRLKGARPAIPFAVEVEERFRATGTAIITSSAESEHSQESELLSGSFFTVHFLQGIRGAADRDHDRRVTLSEAYRYAYNRTVYATARTHQLQHPVLKGQLLQHGSDLVLADLTQPSAGAWVQLYGPGSYLIFDQTDALFAEVHVEDTRARYLIPAGRWLFQKRLDRGAAEEHRLELHAGEERVLMQSDATTVQLTRLESKGRADDGLRHRLQLLGGASGAAVDGHAMLPAIWLGYRHVLRAVELGLDARLASDPVDSVGAIRVYGDYGFHLGPVRLRFGATIEASFHQQRRPERARQFYPGLGLLGGADVRVAGPVAVRLEAGSLMQLVKVRQPQETALNTPISFWFAAGPSWGF